MTSRGTKYWSSAAIPLIAPETLDDIISEVADLGVVISENGTILSVRLNPSNDSFGPIEEWEGRDIRTVLTLESVSRFETRLRAFMDRSADFRPVELNHAEGDSHWEFPIRYSFHRIGPDGEILLLGRDLRPIAEMQQQLVQAQMTLERDYESQRECDTQFRVLMDSMSDAVFFVSTQTGEITEANCSAATLLGRTCEDLIGAQFADCFEVRTRDNLIDGLSRLAMSDGTERMTVALRNKDCKLTVIPTLFGSADDRVLLCRLISEDAGNVFGDDLTRNMHALYMRGPDAIVFSSSTGEVLSANDAFLGMIDAAHDVSLRGSNLADYLQRGSVDLKVMTENAARTGQMRGYATKVGGQDGPPRPAEMSITKLEAGQNVVFAFVLRDTNQGDKVKATTNPTSDQGMQSVVELVGRSTLKDIVAETTDVVEKMCIETAIKLTMNNRVAAAEMLGLSRQSLYVKLRKFGLLSRDPAG